MSDFNVQFYDDFDSSKTEQLLEYLERLGGPDISSQIITLAKYWEEHHKAVYMGGVDGAPDWLRYEHEIWAMGETLRLLLKKKRKLKGNEEILNSIVTVASNRSFGKGRQSFVLLLGECGKSDYGNVLGELLHDREVVGHAIKALRKIKICDYADLIESLSQSESGWIKKEADKYVSNCKYKKGARL